MIPTLETPRLTLAPLNRECASAYESFYTDAAASRLYGGPISAGAAFGRLGGQGIAREASLAAIRHAYESFQWPVVETYMNDDNAPAKALVLSLGGSLSRRQVFPDGLQRNVFVLPRAAA